MTEYNIENNYNDDNDNNNNNSINNNWLNWPVEFSLLEHPRI